MSDSTPASSTPVCTRSNNPRVGEEFLRGVERFSLPPFVADQQFQRFTHRDVVVDHEHDWRRAGVRHDDDLAPLSPGHHSSRLQESVTDRSTDAQGGIERLEESRLTERLEQAPHGTVFE